MTRWYKHPPARAVLDLLGVLAFFGADALGWIPFSKTPFIVLLIWLSLRTEGVGWASIGLARPPALGAAVWRGVILGVAFEALATGVTTPLLTRWLGRPPDLADLAVIKGNARMLALFLGLNWVLAAFGEEVVYRGFVHNRVAKVLGGFRHARIAALVATTTLFAFAHGYQGWTGILQEGLSGLLLGIVALRTGGNLTVPVVAHGVSNSVAFVLIYLGVYPGT